MRTRARVLLMLLFVLGLTAYPSAALAARAASGPTIAPRQVPTIAQMRLGISAGEKIQSVQLGTDRRALERILPELVLAAGELGVRIDSV